MAKNFFALDWYWTVGGDTTKAYSTKVGNYVPSSDAAYVAWKADGSEPHKEPTEQSLGYYLGKLKENLRPIPPVILDAYKEGQAAHMTPLDVMPKVIHFIYNEVRELQAKPPLTFEQFRQAIKDKM